MSDLNLENIVGFKAVDKNGNERQVTVDEMTELVSARIVSAASEISTFAAAAAAGTDEFEDQLPQSDTFSWLRTLDGSKNPTLTSSSAAAKVLGELMNSLKLFPFMEREQILSDINKAIVPGVYGILNNRLDNLPITDWFVLIVISWRYYVVQIAYSLNYFTIYSRRSSESGETWSNWQQIATE
ncbi:pyocin knob domain-containing protein [Phocaeicola vulgatus]|jgi:hypothetical protein|uniref:pyocin knob domain-containing protein n=2 Tax=Phocaeicola vulgatus TaxID=821 RepID=UPI001BDA0AE7|nr:pyocin knob domain-containing protein [Phocaeicola vulgatus]MBT0706502.1 hypothetical protein [Phocaeicola vulgatus]MCB6671742.1 pyocin knob domain-containing protein [Phocaeicola vulgatus]